MLVLLPHCSLRDHETGLHFLRGPAGGVCGWRLVPSWLSRTLPKTAMGYRLHPENPTSDEIARVLKEQIASALADVVDRTANVPERARRARVRCKKIRGALRLIAAECPKRCQREDAAFRDAARSLAVLRETGLALDTLDALREQWGDKIDRGCFAAARRVLLAVQREKMPTPAEANRRFARFEIEMRKAAKRQVGWKVPGKGFEGLSGGFEASYRSARRAFRTAREKSSTTAFYDWRKRSKIHGYHVRLLRGAWPAIMKKWASSMDLLSKLLGDEHDLACLREQILTHVQHRGEKEQTASLLELIEARRTELRGEAVVLGRRLFAEKPGAMVRRVAIWWSTAQENSADGEDEVSPQRNVG